LWDKNHIMPSTLPFSDEQLRNIINLRQRYEVWMDAEQKLYALPYDLRRKTVSGGDYLYEIFDRSGNGKSLGPWSDAHQARFDSYRVEKAEAKIRQNGARAVLEESARLYRALRLPLLSSEAGPICREADRRGLMGTHLLVVGTNAMAAYALEASGSILEAPDETEDFDLAWIAQMDQEEDTAEARVWDMLKAVDSTFTINTERDFQARNARAYEVELLVAPSRADTLAAKDRPRPIPLPEQEWLLLGRPVDHIVGCRDGSPARLVVPDPRYFALHKLWMADQTKRNPLKRPKDRKQGFALLNSVAEVMPQYPLDAAFEETLPPELLPQFQSWRVQQVSVTTTKW
jgi:hypothetical protein